MDPFFLINLGGVRARLWLVIRADTPRDQDSGTESNCVCLCTSCNVVSLSTTDVNLNNPPLTVIATLTQDWWANAEGPTNCSEICLDHFRSPTQFFLKKKEEEDTFTSRRMWIIQKILGSFQLSLSSTISTIKEYPLLFVQEHPNIRHIRHRSRARSSHRQNTINQCSLDCSLHIGCTHCTWLALLLLPSWPIHRVKCLTIPPCQGFHSALHPYRRSQPLRITVLQIC